MNRGYVVIVDWGYIVAYIGYQGEYLWRCVSMGCVSTVWRCLRARDLDVAIGRVRAELLSRHE